MYCTYYRIGSGSGQKDRIRIRTKSRTKIIFFFWQEITRTPRHCAHCAKLRIKNLEMMQMSRKTQREVQGRAESFSVGCFLWKLLLWLFVCFCTRVHPVPSAPLQHVPPPPSLTQSRSTHLSDPAVIQRAAHPHHGQNKSLASGLTTC